LKNCFFLGNYQGAINEANSANLSKHSLDSAIKLERDVYTYRAYIAQNKTSFVLQELSSVSTDNVALQTVKLLASYFHNNKQEKEIVLVTLKEWLSDGNVANNSTLQIVAATIYYHEGNFEEAMRCVYQSNSMEGLALLIQIYLRINRIDLAEKELKNLQQQDEDATVTLLATAWVNLALGGEKVQDSLSTFQELLDKYNPTVLLLNGLAACSIQMKRYSEAEKYLLQAIEKNPSDPDTLVNLIACYQQMGKPTEVVNRQINQLKTAASSHHWLLSLQKTETDFDNFANKMLAIGNVVS